jgi:hypothetical protein
MKIVFALINTLLAIGVGFMFFIEVSWNTVTTGSVSSETIILLGSGILLVVSIIAGWVAAIQRAPKKLWNILALISIPVYIYFIYIFIL